MHIKILTVKQQDIKLIAPGDVTYYRINKTVPFFFCLYAIVLVKYIKQKTLTVRCALADVMKLSETS